MNLLMISLARAILITRCWNDTAYTNDAILTICWLLILIMGFLLFIGALVGINAFFDKHLSRVCTKEHIRFGAIVTIIFLCSIFGAHYSMNAEQARVNNVGACLNVGSYYKMRHLRKIYPKLPCGKQLSKPCKTNSLRNAYSNYYRKSSSLTKKGALEKYRKYKKYYRKNKGASTSNESASLYPQMPKWYDWL